MRAKILTLIGTIFLATLCFFSYNIINHFYYDSGLESNIGNESVIYKAIRKNGQIYCGIKFGNYEKIISKYSVDINSDCHSNLHSALVVSELLKISYTFYEGDFLIETERYFEFIQNDKTYVFEFKSK